MTAASTANDSAAAPPAYPDYATLPVPSIPEDWIARAREVGNLLALDVAGRDARNELPTRQVQLLKDAGLVTVLGPKESGGAGLSWETAYKIQREVASGDGSIGLVLGYHYTWFATSLIVGTAEQEKYWQNKITKEKLFIGGAVNPRDSDLSIKESADGKSIIFNGKKSFSTGSKLSDVTVLEGVLEGTESHIFAIAPSKQPGIIYGDDWVDVLGARGTSSGSIKVQDVAVPWEDALGWVDKKFAPLGAFNTLLLPTIQLAFTNAYLGIAQGALRRAAAWAVKHARVWDHTPHPAESAVEQFHLQEGYGGLQAKLWGVEAQVDVVGATISEILASERSSVTPEQRGEVAVRIAAAKERAVEVGLEITSRIFELTSARAVSGKYGFDLAWRDLRTHTLHDPIAFKRREVGEYVLKGPGAGYPTPTWYT